MDKTIDSAIRGLTCLFFFLRAGCTDMHLLVPSDTDNPYENGWTTTSRTVNISSLAIKAREDLLVIFFLVGTAEHALCILFCRK